MSTLSITVPPLAMRAALDRACEALDCLVYNGRLPSNGAGFLLEAARHIRQAGTQIHGWGDFYPRGLAELLGGLTRVADTMESLAHATEPKPDTARELASEVESIRLEVVAARERARYAGVNTC